MVLEQLDNHTQKTNLDTKLTSYTEINSNCIKDLNVRAVPTKPAEGANFCDLILDNGV